MAGNKNMSTSETKLEALQIQSSAYGVTIPVIGGVNRVPGNLINYLGFTATPITSSSSQGGKGGSTKTQSTTFNYSASVQMAIGHGPGTIARIWKGKEVYTGGWSSANISRASNSFTPASGSMSYTLPNGSTMIGSPTVTGALTETLAVGDSGTDITTTRTVQLSYGTDYSVSGSVLTILLNKWQGVALTIAYQYGTGSPDQTPLTQLGLSLSPGDATQTAPGWLTTANPAQALNYRGLMYVHSASYNLGSGAKVDNHSFEVQGSGAYRYGSSKPDCNPAEFVSDVLMNSTYGAGVPSNRLENASWIQYCAAADLLMSPALTEQMKASDLVKLACQLTNSEPVWSVDKLKIIPYGDVTLTANGVTYTPNTTPIYDLSDDNWTPNEGEDPLVWTDKGQAQRYNNFKLEYTDRSNYYNKVIAEAKDDADIALNGIRTAPTITAHWICDANVARMVVQILLQRSLAITRTGRVTLPWAFCLLEPMDLVTVSDTFLQLTKLPVRITSIGESEDRSLSVEFEDWPLGVASPTAYTTQVPAGYLHDYRAPPGSVATPYFFEAPTELTGTGLEVYAAVKGNSVNWGGCTVWVSLDGATYKKAGAIYGASRFGSLSASSAAADTSIAVTGMSGALLSGSAADAAALTTLCYLGGATYEYISYQTATLTAAGAYTLTGCVRGAYESVPGTNAAGDPFVRVDESIAKSGDLTLDYIGKTIYFKFTSFNIFGGAEESIASVSAYQYTIVGTMAKLPPADASGIVAGVENGQAYIRWNPAQEVDYQKTKVQVGNSSSTSATAATLYEGKASTALWSPYPANGSYNVFVTHYDAFGASSTPQSIAVTVTATGITTTPSGTNLVANGDFFRRKSPPSDPTYPYDPEGYLVYDWNVGVTGVWAWADETNSSGERAFALTNVNAMSAKPDVSGSWVRVGFLTANNILDGTTQGGVSGGWRPNTDYTISFDAYIARLGTIAGTESAIAFLASTGQSGTTPTGTGTVSLTLPVVAAGSLHIVVAGLDDYATAGIAAPAGWTRIGAQQGATGNPDGRVTSAWYKISAAGDPASFVLSVTGGGGYTYSLACSSYSGCDATTPVSVVGAWSAAGAGIATNQPITAASITTTGNTGLVWLGAVDPPSGHPSTNTLTAPSGFTMRRSQWDSGASSNAHIADKLPKAANGTVVAASGTLTSGGAGYDVVMIALKPATTGGSSGDTATEWEGVTMPELFWNVNPATAQNDSASQTLSYISKRFKFKIKTGASVETNGTIYIGVRRTAAVTQMPGLAPNARLVFKNLMVDQGTEYPAFELSPQDGISKGSILTAAMADNAATLVVTQTLGTQFLNSGLTIVSGSPYLLFYRFPRNGVYEITTTATFTVNASAGAAESVCCDFSVSTLGAATVTIVGDVTQSALVPASTPVNVVFSVQGTCTLTVSNSDTNPNATSPNQVYIDLVIRKKLGSAQGFTVTNIARRITEIKK
jgi:hypothetical protein